MEALIAFLRRNGQMGARQAADIAGQFTARAFGAHEWLLREGQVSDEYLLLETGLVRAFVHDPTGDEVTTGLYGGGQVALEPASFFLRAPSAENLQALTAGIGWSLSFAQLNGLFHGRPEFREFGRAVLVRALATLKGRMLRMITEPAAGRYEQLVREQPLLVQQVPLKYLASYLGVTDTSLSRLRAAYRERT